MTETIAQHTKTYIYHIQIPHTVQYTTEEYLSQTLFMVMSFFCVYNLTFVFLLLGCCGFLKVQQAKFKALPTFYQGIIMAVMMTIMMMMKMTMSMMMEILMIE